MKPNVFDPHSDLADVVQCYWTLESDLGKTPSKNTIVPDGTMKLIFHYGDPYRHYPKGEEAYILPKCFLIGQLTQPYVVEATGNTGTFMVRFHPNGFLPFATLPIHQVENTAIALDQLFGEEGRIIGEQILAAKTTSERIEAIEVFLRNRLNDKKRIDQIVQSAVETISTANGQLTIGELSKQNDMSRRVLARKFSTSVGLSPKQLAKIIRLQSTLKTLLNQDVPKLTELAYQSEYFDQAHFIKDFKEFTGLTPKEFYGDDLKMSLIFDTEK